MPGNLPVELSSFVGRCADLLHGDALLGRSRMLTLTGAGGCGKTRLARQLACRAAGRFPDGVWWVALASLSDGTLIADVVARAVGLQVSDETTAADALARYLADAHCLLVLDNCEHVVHDAAVFADGLLLTNPAIGERLFVSRGTVKTHLEHVFAKLGVRSRAELATAATRRGIG